MFDSLFAPETASALATRARIPSAPPDGPGAFGNFWGALVRGPAAGVLDMVDIPARQVEREQNLRVRGLPSLRERDERLPKIGEEIDMQSPLARSVREALTPDPMTTGVMSQIVFGAGNVLTQAGIMGLAGGPLVGAGGVGVVQGAIETGKLQDEGVDTATAVQAGLVKGATMAASFAAPVIGKTLLETLGIIAVTGPGAFMAEQAGIRAVLEQADYDTQAAKYDPFDPVGLTVSTLAPALFAGAAGAMRGAARKALPPDAVEGARALKNQVEAERQVLVRDQADPAVQAAHQKALADAAVAIDAGRPLDGLLPPADPAVVAQVEAEVRARLAADPELRAAVEAAATGPEAPRPDVPLIQFAEAKLEDADGQALDGIAATFDNGRGSTGTLELGIRDGRLFPVWVDNGIYGGERRSSGVVTSLYEAAIREAQARGLAFTSDSSVTMDAARVYDALGRRGYEVTRNPAARMADAPEVITPRWVTDDKSPVFEVKPKAEAAGAKPAPELPETVAARAALARMPDLQLEVGRDADGAPITRSAAELLDEADMEAKQAETDARAFEAAVMCEIGSGA